MLLENVLLFVVNFVVSQIKDPRELEIVDLFDYGTGIFAAFLVVLSLIAYRNAKTRRLLFVSAAFGLFSLRTIIARLDFIIPETQSITIELALSISGFAILLLFFMAIIRKGGKIW
jgi:hypothetical protein